MRAMICGRVQGAVIVGACLSWGGGGQQVCSDPTLIEPPLSA